MAELHRRCAVHLEISKWDFTWAAARLSVEAKGTFFKYQARLPLRKPRRKDSDTHGGLDVKILHKSPEWLLASPLPNTW